MRIFPLPGGEIRGLPRPATHYFRGWGETLDLRIWMFLIEGGSELTLVDTGTPPPELSTEIHKYDVRRPPEEDPIAQLAKYGYAPEDVTRIINTHLHWDHCGNNRLFPNARVFVQRAELDYARSPLDMHRVAFENFPDSCPLWGDDGQIVEVDGDLDLGDGLRIIALPGHTPGSQGVLVELGSGPHLIAGDCVDTHANWEGDASMPHIPSGVYTNLFEFMDSFGRIEELECTVIPSHDYDMRVTGAFE